MSSRKKKVVKGADIGEALKHFLGERRKRMHMDARRKDDRIILDLPLERSEVLALRVLAVETKTPVEEYAARLLREHVKRKKPKEKLPQASRS
jgi:hypothetical protein